MKKILLLLLSLFFTLTYANDYKKDAYKILNNEKTQELYSKYNNLDENIRRTKKIFSLIFKTQTNLVPKFIKYIYFEPMKSDKKLLDLQVERLLVSYNVNLGAKVYIKDIGNETNYILERIKNTIPKENIFILKDNTKNIFESIEKNIVYTYNKNEFEMIEMRILLLTAASQIKKNLAFANSFFNNNLKGVEIENFSYLDITREQLNKTTEKEKLEMLEFMLKGIK